MAVQADVAAARCVDLVMKMLADTDGDHAILRSDQVPVMTRDDQRYRISGNVIPKAVVARIARYLLPYAEMRALSEIGETRYRLPLQRAAAHDDFIVDVTDRGGDLCIDIEHHKLPAADDLPEELFKSRLDC